MADLDPVEAAGDGLVEGREGRERRAEEFLQRLIVAHLFRGQVSRDRVVGDDLCEEDAQGVKQEEQQNAGPHERHDGPDHQVHYLPQLRNEANQAQKPEDAKEPQDLRQPQHADVAEPRAVRSHLGRRALVRDLQQHEQSIEVVPPVARSEKGPAECKKPQAQLDAEEDAEEDVPRSEAIWNAALGVIVRFGTDQHRVGDQHGPNDSLEVGARRDEHRQPSCIGRCPGDARP
mmetsp:Transcript_25263/g.72744  ORF Transcript_25263/g.72744 Transcript_25263/m.72744 type:complete len:232 (+) Transcript_25263:608-1303(+)